VLTGYLLFNENKPSENGRYHPHLTPEYLNTCYMFHLCTAQTRGLMKARIWSRDYFLWKEEAAVACHIIMASFDDLETQEGSGGLRSQG
jgi:hypothetical protein